MANTVLTRSDAGADDEGIDAMLCSRKSRESAHQAIESATEMITHLDRAEWFARRANALRNGLIPAA